MIASLPMYDWPEIQADHDRFWQALASDLGVSESLSRDSDFTAAWARPDLLLSQTCGYPFTHHYRGKLKIVATPHYDAAGCEGPRYSSFILARKMRPIAEFRGLRAAVNTPDSMSGMLALKAVFADYATKGKFFGHVMESGGHVASMAMVRDGKADVCAIDSVCVGLARRYRPELLEGLVEIARSPLVPGLPFVTIAGDVRHLQDALAAVFANEALAPTRDRLLLKGFSILPASDYDVILDLEAGIEAKGGLALF